MRHRSHVPRDFWRIARGVLLSVVLLAAVGCRQDPERASRHSMTSRPLAETTLQVRLGGEDRPDAARSATFDGLGHPVAGAATSVALSERDRQAVGEVIAGFDEISRAAGNCDVGADAAFVALTVRTAGAEPSVAILCRNQLRSVPYADAIQRLVDSLGG